MYFSNGAAICSVKVQKATRWTRITNAVSVLTGESQLIVEPEKIHRNQGLTKWDSENVWVSAELHREVRTQKVRRVGIIIFFQNYN